jgi:uncharacterized protein DUF4038/collagenase-like protein with putative collagen-binding domain
MQFSLRSACFILFIALAISTLTASAQPPLLPLKISGNGRYLLDQNNQAFFLQGDTPWSLISALTKDETARYLDDRRQKRFNALIVNLIEHKYRGPVNREGEPPFTTPRDFATPNEKYFAHADWVLRRAAEKGLVILLAPMYLGFRGTDEGWYQEARLNGEAKCRDYGRYLGRRYKDYTNIIWLMGGDRDPADVRDEVDGLAAGIREFTPSHLFTAHTAPESTPAEQYSLSQWLDLNATYTYGIVHRKLLANYQSRPVRPNILIETSYEGEHNASPLQIRRQAYWALLTGATGQFFGNRPIWGFFPAWEEALNSQGSLDMERLAAFVGSRPWHTLVPDDAHKVVSSGLGEFRGLDYLAAARSKDRRVLIAYVPTPRSFSIQLSELAGDKLRAWWFDPQTGRSSQAGEYRAQGAHEFRTPSDGDWVLVVEDADLRLPGPGQTDGSRKP